MTMCDWHGWYWLNLWFLILIFHSVLGVFWATSDFGRCLLKDSKSLSPNHRRAWSPLFVSSAGPTYLKFHLWPDLGCVGANGVWEELTNPCVHCSCRTPLQLEKLVLKMKKSMKSLFHSSKPFLLEHIAVALEPYFLKFKTVQWECLPHLHMHALLSI